MTTEIFYEDFDDNGPGFKGTSLPSESLTNAAFGSWSIGGVPILAGRWQLSYPEYDDPPNLTGGSGRYASVHSSSGEFIDTHVWMISPLIDIKKYENITLSADLYFKSNGASVGEDTLTISILTINEDSTSADSVAHHTVEVIGQDMSSADPELQGPKTWDLSPFTDACRFIQLAFSWYSSMGPTSPASLQLDNIRVHGDEIATTVHMIKNYVLRYDLDQERPWFIFHYKDNSSWRNVNWYPPKENAVYISDMLRNEKPVYYVESNTGKKWITTSAEQIGEEES